MGHGLRPQDQRGAQLTELVAQELGADPAGLVAQHQEPLLPEERRQIRVQLRLDGEIRVGRRLQRVRRAEEAVPDLVRHSAGHADGQPRLAQVAAGRLGVAPVPQRIDDRPRRAQRAAVEVVADERRRHGGELRRDGLVRVHQQRRRRDGARQVALPRHERPARGGHGRDRHGGADGLHRTGRIRLDGARTRRRHRRRQRADRRRHEDRRHRKRTVHRHDGGIGRPGKRAHPFAEPPARLVERRDRDLLAAGVVRLVGLTRHQAAAGHRHGQRVARKIVVRLAVGPQRDPVHVHRVRRRRQAAVAGVDAEGRRRERVQERFTECLPLQIRIAPGDGPEVAGAHHGQAQRRRLRDRQRLVQEDRRRTAHGRQVQLTGGVAVELQTQPPVLVLLHDQTLLREVRRQRGGELHGRGEVGIRQRLPHARRAEAPVPDLVRRAAGHAQGQMRIGGVGLDDRGQGTVAGRVEEGPDGIERAGMEVVGLELGLDDARRPGQTCADQAASTGPAPEVGRTRHGQPPGPVGAAPSG